MKNIELNIAKTNIPTILKFTSNDILTSGSYQYNNIAEAKNSPLAQQLFYLPFVNRVYISANFIALARFSIVEWSDVQEEVKAQIENYLNQGGVLVSEETAPKKIPVEVYAESTPNPSVLKFVANIKLVDNDLEFKNMEAAENSPLAMELFNFPFVKEVFISENYVSITKNDTAEWNEITVELRSFIKQFIANGKKIVLETALQQKVSEVYTPDIELDDVS